jgi:hypothetical protein
MRRLRGRGRHHPDVLDASGLTLACLGHAVLADIVSTGASAGSGDSSHRNISSASVNKAMSGDCPDSRLRGEDAGHATPGARANTTAKVSAFLSQEAYKGPTVLSASWGDVRQGLSGPVHVSDASSGADASIWLQAESRTVYVAFRGTSDARDALADLWLRKSPLPLSVDPAQKARVHAGFKWQCGSLLSEICGRIASLGWVYDRVVYTGHSLGGALATLAGVHHSACLSVSNGKGCDVVVFGCPRVGDRAFADLVGRLGLAVTRHEVVGDPVPLMPCRVRWRHCGRCVRYDPPDFRDSSPAGDGDDLGRLFALPRPSGTRLHAVGNYVLAACVSPRESSRGPWAD